MKTSLSFSLLFLLLGAATVLNIGLGSVWIPPQEVFQSLFHGPLVEQSHEYILWSYRAPKTATAMAVGGGLALCGLLMQSLFRNPLSGPYVLGLSSGASLGVSLLILGSSIGLPGWALIENTGFGRIAAAALGAIGVLALVVATASRVKDTMALLLVGLMIGSITSAVVSIFTYLSDEQSLKQYAIWTMGQLGGIQGPWLYGLWILVLLGVLLSIPLAKSMNAVLLGESTALSLGIHLKRYQWMVIAITGALTGGITALVGPIAFVGLAV
ncbi:MAG: iron chelate uptake ABC transporter family permease subunit, partial [Flavobacteriaceae bacterium]